MTEEQIISITNMLDAMLGFLTTENRTKILDELSVLDFPLAVDIVSCLSKIKAAEHPPPPMSVAPLIKTQAKLQKRLEDVMATPKLYFPHVKVTARELIKQLKILTRSLDADFKFHAGLRSVPVIKKIKARKGKAKTNRIAKVVRYAEVGRMALTGRGQPPNPDKDLQMRMLVETIQMGFSINKDQAVERASKFLRLLQVATSKSNLRRISDKTKIISMRIYGRSR